MTTAFRALRSLTIAALALGALGALAGCATEKPAPVAVAPPPPPPPPPPPAVGLSTRLLEAASEYRAYMRKAASISPQFADGPAIEQSLQSAASFEPQQLLRGAVAYAAIVALQDQSFVQGVRTFAVDPTQRHDIAQRIIQDPYYAASMPGAASAAAMIVAAVNGDGAKVNEVGSAVKQSAYSIQHQPWSSRPVTDPAGRLAQTKTVSTSPMTATPTDVEELRGYVSGGDPNRPPFVAAPPTPVNPPYPPVVTRGLALAALAALGQAGDENDAALSSLLNEQSSAFCLNLAKLNLYQCLAVARPWYEDVFCLGEHALRESGQCISKTVGVTLEVARPVLTAAPAPPPPAKSRRARRR
jgi:hypothetical protein